MPRKLRVDVAGIVSQTPSSVTVSGSGFSSTASADVYDDNSWARDGATWTAGSNWFTATATQSYPSRSSTDSIPVNLLVTNIFVYDSNGNLRTNGTRIFDYDDENQLIAITEPGQWKSEFAYDGLMRRRVKKESTWSNHSSSAGSGNDSNEK